MDQTDIILFVLIGLFQAWGSESSFAYFACESGSQSVRLHSALWGRPGDSLCPGSSPTECCVANVLQVTQDICESFSECSFAMKSDTLGDPCPNDDKRVDILYMCESYNIRALWILGGNIVMLNTCGVDQMIHVIRAIWGAAPCFEFPRCDYCLDWFPVP